MYLRKIHRIGRSNMIVIPPGICSVYELEPQDPILILATSQGILLKKAELDKDGIKTATVRRDPGAKNRP